MSATNIIRTAPEVFTATIDGVVWMNITPAHRFYENVLEGLEAGEPIIDRPSFDLTQGASDGEPELS